MYVMYNSDVENFLKTKGDFLQTQCENAPLDQTAFSSDFGFKVQRTRTTNVCVTQTAVDTSGQKSRRVA